MKVHTELKRLKTAPGWIQGYLDQDDSRDGAYARVVPMSANKVLKVTCCSATNSLFRALLRQQTPAALPAVLLSHGPVAKDANGLTYAGWEVERLFRPGDDPLLFRQARALGRIALGKYKPSYNETFVHEHDAEQHASLMAALEEEQSEHSDLSDWRVCERIALNMMVRTRGDLRDAFGFLLKFVQDTHCSLDLLTRGNILLNMFGDPVLGDPVCPMEDAPPTSVPPGMSLAEERGSSVLAYVPVKLKPQFQVQLSPFSSQCVPTQDAAGIVTRLKEIGITARTVPYGGVEHQAHLSQGDIYEQTFQYPAVAANLKANRYLDILYG